MLMPRFLGENMLDDFFVESCILRFDDIFSTEVKERE